MWILFSYKIDKILSNCDTLKIEDIKITLWRDSFMQNVDVIMSVEDKKFGKPWITYKAMLTETKEVIVEGKCKDFSTTRSTYKELIDTYGENNVLLLQR